MRLLLAAMVVGGLAIPAGWAAAPEPLSAAARVQMQQAQTLVTAGRGTKDAQKLLQGARIMSRAEAPTASGIDGILDEARGLAAGNTELIGEIEALRRAQPARTSCNWQRLCTATGCSWTQACE